MFSLEIDTSAYHAAYTAELRNLELGCREAVEDSGKSGKATARVLAPHRSYALRDSIEARVTSAGPGGAEGELEATAPHASLVADGTKPHVIQARRKKALRFVGNGGLVYRRRVFHPGTSPNTFFEQAIRDAGITLVRKGQKVVDDVCARMSR